VGSIPITRFLAGLAPTASEQIARPDCWYALPLYALAGLHHIYNITAILAALWQNSQSLVTSALPTEKKVPRPKLL
jgi:hypothetical protein